MKKLFFFILLSIITLTTSKVSAQDPFLGELRLFPYTFTPKGWMSCEGQLLPISQNTALFSLIGTYYGGNGTTNFQLPDLRGYAIVGVGELYPGVQYGTTSNTLLVTQMPAHTHTLSVSTAIPCNNANGTTNKPAVYAVNTARGNEFNSATNTTTTNNLTVSTAGASQPINNMQPYLVMRWCICMQGIFPQRN